MTVPADILAILRCPYCVSGDTRKPTPDPGQLELTANGLWLVCQEADCRRKYPIREGVPVMLIDEGSKWMATAVDALPQPGNLVS